MKAYLKINVNAIYLSEKKFFLTVQRDYTIAILRDQLDIRVYLYVHIYRECSLNIRQDFMRQNKSW